MRDGLEGLPRNSSADAGRLEGRHVLAILLSLFSVVFAVNGYFLWSALSTHTGVVAIEPYRKGLAYNARIAADERQTELGWRDALAVERDGTIRVTLVDRSGTPVRGLAVTSVVGRPATARFDRAARLVEESPGQYIANVSALADGRWLVTIEAGDAANAEPVFRLRRRLWLKP